MEQGGREKEREREVDLVELFSDLVLVNRFLKLTVPTVERYSYLLKTRVFFKPQVLSRLISLLVLKSFYKANFWCFIFLNTLHTSKSSHGKITMIQRLNLYVNETLIKAPIKFHFKTFYILSVN